jgi:hypothetical protein
MSRGCQPGGGRASGAGFTAELSRSAQRLLNHGSTPPHPFKPEESSSEKNFALWILERWDGFATPRAVEHSQRRVANPSHELSLMGIFCAGQAVERVPFRDIQCLESGRSMTRDESLVARLFLWRPGLSPKSPLILPIIRAVQRAPGLWIETSVVWRGVC